MTFIIVILCAFAWIGRLSKMDINEFYGEYQAGEDCESKGPLTDFTFDDIEPGAAAERG